MTVPMGETILHVFDHSLPLHSGYSFRSRAIVTAQRALGWRTVHITSSKQGAEGPTEETIDGLEFHRTHPGALAPWPILGQWDVVRTLVPRICEVARAERVDLIHAHSPCLVGLAALRAGRILGLPVVYEVRAFWEDAAVDHGTTTEGSVRYRATRAIETYVLRHADHVTCICEGLRRDIVARGVDSSRVTVIPNAVNVADFPMLTSRDDTLGASLGIGGKQVLGFIGSFYAYEGLDLLLEALPAICLQVPDARLLLVGGGPQEDALRAQAERLGIADRVVFAGRVPQARVPAYSSLVDAFVFPRKSMRLTELVTPLKPLEAMAQGRIVLASDVGGHRELIEDGVTGYLFRHEDIADLTRCVVGVLSRPVAPNQIIARGREFVENQRNWRTAAQRYADVYLRARHR